MALKDIKLWEKNVPDADLVSSIGDLNNDGLPTLTPYLLKGEKPRPAIIVCPGGSFQFRAYNEGKPIGDLNQNGVWDEADLNHMANEIQDYKKYSQYGYFNILADVTNDGIIDMDDYNMLRDVIYLQSL